MEVGGISRNAHTYASSGLELLVCHGFRTTTDLNMNLACLKKN